MTDTTRWILVVVAAIILMLIGRVVL